MSEPKQWPFALQAKCPDCGKPLGEPGHVHTCSPQAHRHKQELRECVKRMVAAADSEGGEV